MALKKAHASYPNAYHRIEMLRGNKDGASVVVRVYEDAAAAADPEGEAVHQVSSNFVPGGEGRWDNQGYEHLKRLPEYTGAADV